MLMHLKKLPAAFYATPGGNEPVREWLSGLNDEDRRIMGVAIATVEFGWPVGMPLCRLLGQRLWEIRVSLPGRRIARVIFIHHGRHMVLLHGFIKKTRKTPRADFELAVKRKSEVIEWRPERILQ